ncbi:hypothetical protein CHUAL_002809 [Chamberlinius hualienensis]
MNYFVVAIFACLAFLAQADVDDWCDINNPICERDECCVQDPRGRPGEGICRDLGDDSGDPCGGSHFCGCEYGYVCVPHSENPAGYRPRYQDISNGTCQRDPTIAGRYRQSGYRRGGYYDDDDDRRRRR